MGTLFVQRTLLQLEWHCKDPAQAPVSGQNATEVGGRASLSKEWISNLTRHHVRQGGSSRETGCFAAVLSFVCTRRTFSSFKNTNVWGPSQRPFQGAALASGSQMQSRLKTTVLKAPEIPSAGAAVPTWAARENQLWSFSKVPELKTLQQVIPGKPPDDSPVHPGVATVVPQKQQHPRSFIHFVCVSFRLLHEHSLIPCARHCEPKRTQTLLASQSLVQERDNYIIT